MFTGLVEEVAAVRRVEHLQAGARIVLTAKRVLEGMVLGDSIAVNGVCLTVTSFSDDAFSADAVPETMRRTNLGQLHPGDPVNLERALRVGDRLGGHMVAGHVDGTGQLRARASESNAIVLTVSAPTPLMRYIADKGSICVDGVSLTVMDVTADVFRVSVIPHTGVSTTLLQSRVGTPFNLECDVIAKYVERLLLGGDHAQTGAGTSDSADPDTVSIEFLRSHGFA